MSDKIVIYKQLDKIMKDNLYPSIQVLYEIAKYENSNVTMKQIKEYVESQKAYQLTKERKITKLSMGHVVSYKPSITIFQEDRYKTLFGKVLGAFTILSIFALSTYFTIALTNFYSIHQQQTTSTYYWDSVSFPCNGI